MALVVVGTLSLVAPPHQPPAADTDGEPDYVRLNGTTATFWPYLSAERAHNRGSPINVVVAGDLDTVVGLLQRGEFRRVDDDQRDADERAYSAQEVDFDDGTAVRWGETTGAVRYTSVETDDRRWITESQHLHEGTYYGSRRHLRLYEVSGSDDDRTWVLIQAHSEHFDWFTLRHAVDGVDAAQNSVEEEFMDEPFTDRVWRLHLDNDEPYDSDGWTTVVELAVLFPLLIGVFNSVSRVRNWIRSHTLERDRRRLFDLYRTLTWRHALLAASIVVLYLGVRIGGVLLELHTGLSMHSIAAGLYPFVALGIPLSAYLIANGIERRTFAAVVAAAALAFALVVDYGALGVDTLPLSIVIHRVGLLVAVGLIAGGAANRATRIKRLNDMEVAGVLFWLVLLAATLFGLV